MKREQQPQTVIGPDTEPISVCVQCGTDASTAWKQLQIGDSAAETMCAHCSGKVTHLRVRKDFEEKIRDTQWKYREQERNLLRDYNDMLSSPKKLEMFRQEQEKRQRLQRIATVVKGNGQQNARTAASKPNNESGKNSGLIASSATKRAAPPQKEQLGARANASSVPPVNAGEAPLTNLQFLQALAAQATSEPCLALVAAA